MPTKKRAVAAEHEDRSVAVTALHFDPKNPRGEELHDEVKILALFAAEDETYVLATHIAEFGLNPLDRLGVIDHPDLPGHYVIREGNRRLSAIQLLRDPQRAPTIEIRRKYERLAKAGREVPSTVSVVYFPKKPTTRIWMSVKHEGPQRGLGTLTWGPAQKARFNREGETGVTRPKNPNRQAEALLTYAVSRGLITQEQREQISITTITRYLPNVRTALALLNNEDTTTNASQAAFDTVVQSFLLDAIIAAPGQKKPALHSRSGADERDGYAETLRERGLAPIERTKPPYQPRPQAPNKPTAKKPTGRSATHPGKSNQLIRSGFVVTLKDTTLQRMVAEGKSLHPDDARFSCNYLNRAILERVVYLYCKKYGVGFEGAFSGTLDRVKQHAQKLPEPPSKGVTHVLSKAGDLKSSYSYEILGNGVHGGHIPSGADNRSNWESLEPALAYLLSKLP